MGAGLCERCGKSHATFHLLEIAPDGEKTDCHLCDSCASAQGYITEAKTPTADVELIEKFISVGMKGMPKIQCEECGMWYSEFRQKGLLGCPHDYVAFKTEIEKLLTRAHDEHIQHIGKFPRSRGRPRKNTEQDLRKLRRLLNEAVAAEDYERAAELRDRIAEQGGA